MKGKRMIYRVTMYQENTIDSVRIFMVKKEGEGFFKALSLQNLYDKVVLEKETHYEGTVSYELLNEWERPFIREVEVTDNDDLMEKYTTKKKLLDENKAMGKELTAELENLEGKLLDYMLSSGKQSFSQNGVTVFIKEELNFRLKNDGDKDEVIEYLKRTFPSMIKENYNTNSLKSLVRELMEQKDYKDLDNFQKYFNMEKVPVIRARKAR